MWDTGTNSSHEELVPIRLMCEELVPILHTSEIINMWNLSTDFTPTPQKKKKKIKKNIEIDHT